MKFLNISIHNSITDLYQHLKMLLVQNTKSSFLEKNLSQTVNHISYFLQYISCTNYTRENH